MLVFHASIVELPVLVPRASLLHATYIGPGIHGTGSARKLAVVSKALAPVTISTKVYYEETKYLC